MDDFKLMYKILKIIHACEGDFEWSENLLLPDVLHVSQKKRDNTLMRLADDGLITGVSFDSWIGSVEIKVSFEEQPCLTIAGIEFLETNSLMKKAAKQVKDIAVGLASQTVVNILTK